MKLPSIQQVLRESGRTFRRFPFVLIDAWVVTLAAVILIDHEGPRIYDIFFRVLFAGGLGLPLFFASALAAERRNWSRSVTAAVHLACVLILVAYAFTVPSSLPYAPEFHVQRFFVLALSLCLLVTSAPLTAVRQLNDLWHFNRFLVQRLLITGVFSATLYAGLALALASVDLLFGVEVPGKRYGELAVVILGVFATWCFLGDVPSDLNGAETRSPYPAFLRVFGQYILSPMLVVYFVILYAYVVKIAIEWSWPKGIVAGTIFGFAAIGLAAYLLLYPIREKSENSWIKISVRWFWIAMIPMVVVLELAIWRRVSEYGFTENRYIGFVLGLWLAAMALYFLIGRARSIRVIPASLCVLALVVSFGPWSMFRVSERSQVNRLEQLLARNQLLVSGTVQRANEPIPMDDAAEISSIIRYLHSTHGYEGIQHWFSTTLMVDSANVGSVAITPDSVVALLGVEYSRFYAGHPRERHELQLGIQEPIDIAGYDRMVTLRFDRSMLEVGLPEDGFVCHIDTNLNVITARVFEDGSPTDSAQISVRPLVDSLLATFGHTSTGNLHPVAVSTETETMKLRFTLRRIGFRRDGDERTPVSYDAAVMYSETRPQSE
ncbi:MAG: hypothetical protein Kow0074_10030 [Candidatus Zixiibacteriota bacterium]